MSCPAAPAHLCCRGVLLSQAFFAQIYSEAQSSRAAPGHVAIAELHRMGRLQRHYTLNIDGLAAVRSSS
jgi:NAD-dependent SIR2 family protein deacetylase